MLFHRTDAVRSDTVEGIKAWIQLTHDAFIGVGCVQTEDTGQLDIESITGITLVNSTLGYRIYELNDSLSATYPIYIKVTFAPRRSSNTSTLPTTPNCSVDFGKGTDGLGGLVGAVSIGDAYGSSTGSSGAISYYSSSHSLAYKEDGYLVALVGQTCFSGPAYGYGSPLFFLLKRLNNEGDFTVIYPTNNAGARSTSKLDLFSVTYQYFTGQALEFPALVFMGVANSIVNGNVHTVPAVVASNDGISIIPECVCFPLAAYSPNVKIPLTLDGVSENLYFTFLIGSTSTSKSFHSIPDSRNDTGYNFAVKVG
ncbi:hypothetical protein [Acinetobacter sp. 197]|uniref:hypothetical protein n=1 Tax=Acinetobacter sp. 197 TaxID=3114696 RepID=UPI003A89DE9C